MYFDGLIVLVTPGVAWLLSHLIERADEVLERMSRVIIRRGETVEKALNIPQGIFSDAALSLVVAPGLTQSLSLSDIIQETFVGINLAWAALGAVALAAITIVIGR